ncbi:MAG: Uma2 family endonuclease [Deinococcales bacterium]
MSLEAYLEFEAISHVRHEYLRGDVDAMAGSSIAHNTIIGNIQAHLLPQARQQGCGIYTENIKLKINDDIIYYPDLMIYCPKADPKLSISEKPCLIIEVLSPATKRKDNLEKALLYCQIESLESYLLIDSQDMDIYGYYRQRDGWQKRYFSVDDVIEIPCLNTHLNHATIYQDVFA